MKESEVRRVVGLLERRAELRAHIKILNDINGGAEFLAVPAATLGLVDQKLAAKGLLSLLLEEYAKTDEQMKTLGVEPG